MRRLSALSTIEGSTVVSAGLSFTCLPPHWVGGFQFWTADERCAAVAQELGIGYW
jgi:hypothetical protein